MVDQGRREAFVEALQALGGSAGNGKLRDRLGLDESAYEAVKSALLADGTVQPGRGRGGSVSLAHTIDELAALLLSAEPDSNEGPDDPRPARKPSGRAKSQPKAIGGDLGFEAKMFLAADKLRGNMEPSDYKHVALGLIFLKHISDSFEAKRAELLTDYPDGAEDRDEYAADNVFWVPPTARWSHLQANAKQPAIGKLIDAMEAIEKDNKALEGVLPKDYGRPALNSVILGRCHSTPQRRDAKASWPLATNG
jgi:type I restriction enzyme M protein